MLVTITDPFASVQCSGCFIHGLAESGVIELKHDLILIGREGTVFKKGKHTWFRIKFDHTKEFGQKECPYFDSDSRLYLTPC